MPSRDYLLGRRDLAAEAINEMRQGMMIGRNGERWVLNYLEGQLLDAQDRLRRRREKNDQAKSTPEPADTTS